MKTERVRGTNANAINPSSRGPDQVYTGPPETPHNGLATYRSACLNSTTLNYSGKGVDWVNMKVANGGGYSHIMLPNDKACVFSTGSSASSDNTMIGASSRHPGGVNVAFLDGSVKFIKSTTSPATWWAIATKAGGELICADQL